MSLNPQATFDTIFLACRLQRQTNSFSSPGLHLFAYLACLLWIYSGRSVSDWGYDFVGTELGAPFSQKINDTYEQLLKRGMIVSIKENQLQIIPEAETRLNDTTRLHLNRERVKCLEAAFASTIALSTGIVSSALSNEPELSRARELPAKRPLLEEAGCSRIYRQFDALRNCLKSPSNDLRLPTVVWLTALYSSYGLSGIKS